MQGKKTEIPAVGTQEILAERRRSESPEERNARIAERKKVSTVDPKEIFGNGEAEIMTNVIEGDDGDESPEEVMLDQHRAMVELPENAVEVEMKCKVYHDGELISVSKVMDLSGLREAFRKADDGYIDEDDRFVITDKGRERLEKMREEGYD